MASLKSLITFQSAPAARPESAEPEPKAWETMLGHYNAVRRQMDLLTAPLSPEDHVAQSGPQTSPAKWHMAHATWFFETFVLTPYLSGYRPFHPLFRALFNSHFNSAGAPPEKAMRSTLSRPSLDQVRMYCRYVDDGIENLLQTAEPSQEAMKLVELGIHREQQHQELLIADIKHTFWVNPLRPAYQGSNAPATAAETAPPQKPHAYAEGLYDIGAQSDQFSFDHERPRHKVYLQPFRFAVRLVTCGEYMAFIEDRGYSRQELWLADGWKAVQANDWKSPLYWEKAGQEWKIFTCFGTRKLNEHEPVCHVSYYEADAFARWAGARIPTEFEWEVAASQVKPEGNLLEDGHFHPSVARHVEGDGPMQIFGDAWEWTANSFQPYPGFKPAPGAAGEYNGEFMCNQMVLRGGSCATPRSHVRTSYRKYLAPDARWQFSGIRLADDSM
ncbi:MAG TPA: ergothioneine biosynthesis protein EgtB [Candidatus Saccharimonadales bacterium]|jgi:ergothioneine biosynthesis protein EgtB|nr:ergothioneine biosynthesis protein EgtB [Candidatus Saccharimonadales bacterium]